MSRFKKCIMGLLALVIVLPLSISIVNAQDEVEDFSFLLTFIPNIQFSPIYVALENGYFDENNLAPTVEYLDEPVVVDLVAADPRTVGIVSGEQVIASRAGERPVVYAYAWFQQYPIGIVVAENSDITSVADLRGRKVGIPGRFGASYSGLTALLTVNDLSENDIQLETIGFNAPEIFCTGVVEASVVYVNNEPLQIAARANAGDCGDVAGVRVFAASEALNLVSNGLIFSEQTIADNPEYVTRVIASFHQGLTDAINNPALAYLATVPYVETLPFNAEIEAAFSAAADAQAAFLATNPDRTAIAESRLAMREALALVLPADALLQFDVLLLTITLWEAEQLGYTDPEAWVNMQETLLSLQIITEPIDLTAAYTNAFVPSSGE